MPFYNSKIIKNTDIFRFPAVESNPDLRDITIGDLHANAIKFLYFLFRNDVIGFKEKLGKSRAYEKLVNIYESLQLSDNLVDTLFKEERKQASSKRKKSTNDHSQIDVIENRPIDDAEKARYTSQIKSFAALLKNIEIHHPNKYIRLIGDELADRGANDIFILMIFKFLKLNAVNVNTLISNHGIEFLNFYFTSKKLYQNFALLNSNLKPLNKSSLFGLKQILLLGIISKEEFIDYVENYYLPTLKVLDYNLTEDGGIEIFSHAPVRFGIIKYLVERLNYFDCELGLEYHDENPQELARTIDNINALFREYLTNDKYDQLFYPYSIRSSLIKPITITHFNEGRDQLENIGLIKLNPFYYIIWNRWSEIRDNVDDARPALHPQWNYNIYYIHGHDPFESPKEHIFNLDSEFGKFPRFLYNSVKEAFFYKNSKKPIRVQLRREFEGTTMDIYKEFNTIRIPGENVVLDIQETASNIDNTGNENNPANQHKLKFKQYLKNTGIVSVSLLFTGMITGISLTLSKLATPFGANILDAFAFGTVLGGSMGIISGILGINLTRNFLNKTNSEQENNHEQLAAEASLNERKVEGLEGSLYNQNDCGSSYEYTEIFIRPASPKGFPEEKNSESTLNRPKLNFNF